MIVLFLLFATGLCLFLAGLIQLVYKNKTYFNYIMCCMYFSLAYFMIYIWMYNLSVLPSLLLGTDTAIPFFIGPLLFLYFAMISGFMEKKVNYIVPVFIQFIIVFLLIVLLNGLYPVVPAGGEESFNPYLSLPPRLKFINSLSDYYFSLCAVTLFIFLLKKGALRGRRNNYILVIFALSILFLFGSSLMLLSHFIRSDALVTVAIGAYGVFGFASILFTYRYPKETQLILAPPADTPKEKVENPLWLNEAERKLRKLLEKDRIYSRPGLSVTQVADMIGITANQLSWMVNHRYEMNFKSLINTCRLEEAKTVLAENQAMNIIEVAFYTGFNSKSSFNTHFKDRFGMTPREYRKGESS